MMTHSRIPRSWKPGFDESFPARFFVDYLDIPCKLSYNPLDAIPARGESKH